jgi:outer membrane protein assembly factor BamD
VAAVLIAGLFAGCGGTGKRKPLPIPPPTPNEVLYERGRNLVEQRKFVQARKALTEIGTREVQIPALDPLVKIALADSYYYQTGPENLIEAESRYTQFVSFYPSHELAGYAQFQLGMCNYKQSPVAHLDQTFTRKAIEEFEKVEKINPNGRFARAANQMRERCHEKLAGHDYQVGIFYYKRKAFPGAITRFKNVLESYPRFEQTDAVYFHLGMALVRSGNSAEGDIYLEKLVRDYPSSRFVSEAKAALQKQKSRQSASRIPEGPEASVIG